MAAARPPASAPPHPPPPPRPWGCDPPLARYRLKTLSALHFSTNAFTLISIGYLSTGQRRPVPVTTVEANVRDAASRQQPRLPGNSGPRSVQPMPDRPRADTPPPPPPAKVAVKPAGSSSSGAGASGAVVAGAPVTPTDGAELQRARRVPGPDEEVPTGGPSRLARIHTPASTAFDAVH